MGAKSRTKGAEFEREVARRLRLLLGEGWTVQRVPSDRQRGQGGQAGDLVVTGPKAFPWVVECKSHKGFNPAQLLDPLLPGPFDGWWAQASAQAYAVEGKPALVVRVPNRDLLVAVDQYDLAPLPMRSGDAAFVPTPCVTLCTGVVVGPWASMAHVLRAGVEWA